jgi:predicted nucleotidyltransferase
MPFSDLLEQREAQRKEHEAEALAAAEECCRRMAREYPCGRIWIFGSLARGRFHRHSDFDIAVEGLPEALFFKAHAFLMRCLPAKHDVDLKPFESLPPAIRRRIEKEGRLIVG